jgi:hypothetical protein
MATINGVTPMTLTDQLVQLQNVAGNLIPSDRKFALDLIDFYAKRQYLTPKQTPWVGRLIAKATPVVTPAPAFLVVASSPAPVVEPVAVGNFADVIALFDKAKAHLKFPKITLLCDGKPVKLSVLGVKSKFAGSVTITDGGKYPYATWYGRVSPDGTFVPSLKTAPEFVTALTDLLVKFGKTPARMAKEHGKLTGNCCFCNKGLTDPNSTAAGFGPVCAKHYGLTNEWKTAVAKADAAEVTPAVTPALDLVAFYAKEKAEIAAVQNLLDSVTPVPVEVEVVEPVVEVEVPKCLFCETNPGLLVKNGVHVCGPCIQELGA